MKSVFVFIFFLLADVLISQKNSAEADVLMKHDDEVDLFKFQFEGGKLASFFVNSLSDSIGEVKEPGKNASRLMTGTPSLVAGAINVSPTRIYDNGVAGGGPGINRSVIIKNTGSGILSVSAINIAGINASEFVLNNLPALPVNINPGDSTSFSVAFNPSSVGLKTASVSITSDDGNNPVVSGPLRGLGTSGLGGANEPSLQSILNLLEIPINVGDDDPSTAVINSSTILQKAPLLGEEVNIKHFQKAGSGNVTITPLAVFGPIDNATVLGMGWYKSGNISTVSELFTVSNTPLSNGQTVNVNFTGSLSFDPVADTFGFYSRWPFFSDRHLYSEDNLNTFSGAIPHHVRVYPYKTNSGAVPNTYLVTFEEHISGFDYQDLIFVVHNVKPATPLSNALLFVENSDKFPSNDNFVFSKVQIPWSRDGIVYNDNHDSIKVRIHNKGINPLIISDLRLSSDTTWEIEQFDGVTYTLGMGLPKTVNSGSYVDLILRFTALNQAARAKVLHETLTVVSNDDTYPSKTIFLHGLWQKAGEGSNEPYAQEIIDAFGFKTKTGFDHTDPDSGDSITLKGDEIKPSYFVRADTSLPVSVRQMGAYHGCCNDIEKLVWYFKDSTTLNTIYTHSAVDGQTLLPRKFLFGTAASGTFIPEKAFGFKIGSSDYTDAAKNPDGKIGIRVWKAFDSKGNIIPNSYIIANDYLGTASTNYDYNDNTHFVSNIKPATGSAFFSALSVNPSALEFNEKILHTSDSLVLSIKNNGKTYVDGSTDPALTISSVEITGENKTEFFADMPLKKTLSPQETSTIKVKFNPVSEGLKIADLLIYYNNSLSPLRVPLYGIAKATGTAVIANYRIKSGSSIPIIINGKIWSPDDQYSFDNLEPYTNTGISQIAATDEDLLYLTEQSSNGDKKPFRYEIPVPNGDYQVRLHFAEIYWGNPGSGLSGGAGSRVMSVKFEDQLRLINFDVSQDVGKAAAIIKNFPVTVTDGKLNIDFSASVNRPMVCAVEVYSFISSPLANNTLNLKGILINNKVELKWVISDETDTKYFEIQRSTNKSDFISLGEVAYDHTAYPQNNYSFNDSDPERGDNFYRIKEVDLNGKIAYSKIIRINFSNVLTVKLFPNPAKKKINIQFAGVEGVQKSNLSIQTLSGNILKRIAIATSDEKIEVDISSLSAGLYIISVSGNNFVIHKKFLKN
jgi:hypothetical protein